MPEIGGSWNYIARLVEALASENDDNNYICFVTSESSVLVPKRKNFETVNVRINPTSRPKRVLYENTILQLLAMKYRLHLMHWFANTTSLIRAIPSVVTVHDLLYFEEPDRFPFIKRLYLQRMTRYAVKHASFLLPVSRYTAESLASNLGANYERMMVIPAIVDDNFRPVDTKKANEFRQKYNLPENFWLYVAHFYPHKNHRRLLEAYHYQISKGFTPWPLVLRGDDHGEMQVINKLIDDLDLRKKILFLPKLKEEDLPVLFSVASALVFPSLYEGGGIPVLEAMACGCPVIASNIPTTREFGGDAVLMFDPLSIDSISAAMEEFQTNLTKREHFRQKAFNRVLDNRPHNIKKKLIEAYNNI